MNELAKKIKDKGVTKTQVSKMTGVNISMLSRIINDKQEYVSERLLNKIHAYLDGLNTNEIN